MVTPTKEGLYWVRFDQGRARDIFGPDLDNVFGVEYRDDGACVAWWGGFYWTILGHSVKIPPDAIREVDSLIYSAE